MRQSQLDRKVDYMLHGDDLQFVEIALASGETVVAEAGAMLYMEEGIAFEARMSDGSNPDQGLLGRLGGAAMRVVTGEGLFMTHFTYQGNARGSVAFGAPYPGKIIAVDLAQIGGSLLCQKGSFLCATLGTSLSTAFNKRIGTGLFGGEGFILQKVQGDGLVFIHAGGMVIERQLDGGKLSIDTGCIVAFESGIDYSIERAGSLKSMLFGGEGLFLATLQGRGRVWLQSLPFSRLADRMIANAPSLGGKQTGEGSVLGSATRFLQRR